MSLPFSRSLTQALVAFVCLAASWARAQDWEPLKPRLDNHGPDDWAVRVTTESPDWAWGYAPNGSAAPPEAFPAEGKVDFPPGRSLRLFVKRPAGAGASGSARLEMDDRGFAHSSLVATLEVQGSGAQSRVRQRSRHLGVAVPPRALIFLCPEGVLITPARDLPPPAAESKARPVPALSAEDREAGVDYPVANYTIQDRRTGWFEHPWWGMLQASYLSDLHQHGHVMPEEILGDYFLNTLFSYNTKRCTGHEPGFNYDVLPTLSPALFDANIARWVSRLCNPDGVHVLDEPRALGDFRAFLAYRDALERAMAAFKRNIPLVCMGIAYMRQKIVTEKLQEEMWATPKDAAAHKPVEQAMYARDATAETLQKLIFAWMQEGYAAFVGRYREADAAHKPAAGDFLETFEPSFIGLPEYRKLQPELARDREPARQVGEIKLPD